MTKRINLKSYIEPIIHILIWSVLFFMMWYNVQTLGQFRKQDGSIYLPLIWNTLFNTALFYSNVSYLIPRYVFKQQYAKYIIWAIVLCVIIISLNTFLDQIYSLSLFSTEKEPFQSDLLMNIQSKIIIFSLSVGYGLTSQWIKIQKLEQDIAKDKLTNELKYLKAQINPHFLFNTLNMAYASATKSNDAVTADIIEKLSGLMRYVLYESNEDKVPLENEIQYINNSVNLQVQRLSAELAAQIKYQVIGDLQNLKIAPMILIPFIENVFKHGIILSRVSEVLLSITLEGDFLTLETKNAKPIYPIPGSNNNSGIGLSNAKKRLQLLYPNMHTLEIQEDESEFRIKLKLQIN
jgi:two-component system LytT family sensor kinase